MEKLVFFVISLFLAITLVFATPSDCGSEVGTLTSIVVEGCKDEAPRCILKRNTNASIQITFSPKEDVEAVNAVVHGIILGVPAPFNLDNPDGCIDSGMECPLKAGQSYTYTAELPILKKYPRVTVDVKWQLQDSNEKDLVCVLIPSKLM